MFTEIISTYYEKVYTRYVEASVQAWSAHDKSCYLKPSSQLAVPVPRQSYLGPSQIRDAWERAVSWQDSENATWLRRTVAMVGERRLRR